ncbi:MAG: OmpA family protein [Bacteroidia bacterium]|nr:OmpA family protein [Bacteroidia bacterium]
MKFIALLFLFQTQICFAQSSEISLIDPQPGQFLTVPIYDECKPKQISNQKIIEIFTEIIQSLDSFSFIVEVHSDCRAENNYNRQYTAKIADSIVANIKRNIKKPVLITAKGMGESQLVNDCDCESKNKYLCTEAQHQENRRAVLRIDKKISSQPCHSVRKYDSIDFKHPADGQIIKAPIYFDFDKPKIWSDGIEFLKALAPKLAKLDSFLIIVEFHSDCRSSEAYNMDMSQRRADTIVSRIKMYAGKPLVIEGIGMGEQCLVNECNCEGATKERMTHYLPDTINGKVIFHGGLDPIKDFAIVSRDVLVPCLELEHQRNRMTVIWLVKRKF